MSSIHLATFTAKGYGTKRAFCTALSWGTSVQGEDSESRQHSTFYPKFVSSSSFSIEVAFPTHKAWRAFMEWIEAYSRIISDPNSTVGPMVVFVPARDFTKVAIPSDGFGYGDRTSALVRRSTLDFEGASDPVRPGQRGTTSEPTIPTDAIVASFYPTGFQAGGRVEDALYNGAPNYANGGDARLDNLANEMNQRNGGPAAGDVPMDEVYD